VKHDQESSSLWRTVCVVALAAGGMVLGCCASGGFSSAPPNVILVLTDDQGYGDAGIHGNTVIRTPNLDRFASEGVEFTRFYVEPLCAPTRASLMTGRYYYRTGVLHTSRGGAKMHAEEVTLAEILRARGYRTGIFGKWHLGDNYPMRPMDQGFDEALWFKAGGIGQAPDKPNSYFDPWLWRNGKRFHASGYCTDVFFGAAIDFRFSFTCPRTRPTRPWKWTRNTWRRTWRPASMKRPPGSMRWSRISMRTSPGSWRNWTNWA